jgi:peroxiredoxin Q/BCP|tara:strand:+ start:854 stop:1027 length:174 start_codon:yes stop_codon:yes gene_type:complete
MFAASINTVFSEKVSLKEGEFAPDFSLEDQDGKIHSLSSYKGQRVILYFFPYADTPG